ncbi:hypothetical protein OKW35_005298 [Paraburkholderia sp. MM5477-R1]
MRRSKLARHLQRFAFVHDHVSYLFMDCRYHAHAKQEWAFHALALEAWESVTGAPMLERPPN